jgi:hypothetical protein
MRTTRTTVGELEEFWEHDASDLGMLGPVGYELEEELLVAEVGPSTYQILRCLDGEWIDCMEYGSQEVSHFDTARRLAPWVLGAGSIGDTRRTYGPDELPPRVVATLSTS